MEQKNVYDPLQIVCIAGGSGVGKTTLKNKCIEHHPEKFTFSISATTRPKGEFEIDGKDYFFLSPEEFSLYEDKNLFIETNPFATGHRYGTLLAELERAQREEKILIVDCEVNGAISIFNEYPGSTFPIFLDGDDHVVQKRLENSGTRKRDKIPERIKNLQEQRVKARESGIFKLNWDTSRMNELFVFSIIETVLLEEIRYRKHFKHL